MDISLMAHEYMKILMVDKNYQHIEKFDDMFAIAWELAEMMKKKADTLNSIKDHSNG